MKKFKITIAAILAVLIVMPLFNGCKKGENDPFFSIKSRKARLVGEWTVTNYSLTQSSGSATYSETYNGTTMTVTMGGSSDVYTGTWTIKIVKDGSYESAQSLTYTGTGGGSYINNDKGNWYFTGGGKASDTKEGELVCMQSTQNTSTGSSTSTTTFSGGLPPDGVVYVINQLKNKEVILTRSFTETDAGSSTTTTICTETMTLTQK